MDIKLYGSGDVVARKGKGGKSHGARYGNYTKAIQKHLDWLKEQIAISEADSDGAIRVKLADFATECGMKMKKVKDGKVVDGTPGLDPTSLGWGFKYSLHHAGISFNLGKVEDGQPVMIMRLRGKDDVLPKSLQDPVPGSAEENAEKEAAEAGDEHKEGNGDGNGDDEHKDEQ